MRRPRPCVNCRPSSTGATRTWGRCCSSRPGSISSTCPGDALFKRARRRRRDHRARRRGAPPRQGRRRPARSRSPRRVAGSPRSAASRSATRWRRSPQNTVEHMRRGARAARRQDRAAALRHRLPRPARADRRARGGPQARPARAAALHPRREAGARRRRRRRRRAARRGLQAGHDRRRHRLRDERRCAAAPSSSCTPTRRARAGRDHLDDARAAVQARARRPAPARTSRC